MKCTCNYLGEGEVMQCHECRQNERIRELEEALAAAAVQVPEEVLDAVDRQWVRPSMAKSSTESRDIYIACNFILQLAGRKDGK